MPISGGQKKKCSTCPTQLNTHPVDLTSTKLVKSFKSACTDTRKLDWTCKHERKTQNLPADGNDIPCPSYGKCCALKFGLRSSLRNHEYYKD